MNPNNIYLFPSWGKSIQLRKRCAVVALHKWSKQCVYLPTFLTIFVIYWHVFMDADREHLGWLGSVNLQHSLGNFDGTIRQNGLNWRQKPPDWAERCEPLPFSPHPLMRPWWIYASVWNLFPSTHLHKCITRFSKRFKVMIFLLLIKANQLCGCGTMLL